MSSFETIRIGSLFTDEEVKDIEAYCDEKALSLHDFLREVIIGGLHR